MAMEARMEKRLASLLEGRVEEQIPGLADVPGYDSEFRPVTKKTVGYIVSAVLLSSTGTGEILMIQEAKTDVKGKWYLPAGKVNPRETFAGAVVRVVKAKSGYEFKPSALISVEVCTGHWYRFTFTGKVTGGYIKTKDMRNESSIQARWFPMPVIRDQRIITLRSEDIMPVIMEALRYNTAKIRHPPAMPLERSYPIMIYRLVLVHQLEGGRVSVLVNKKRDGMFPTGAISNRDNWIHQTKYRIMEEVFGRENVRTMTHGVLSVEYLSEAQHESDGVCITCLVSTDEQKSQHKEEKYAWLEIMDSNLTQRIKDRMMDGMCLPLMDIH